MGLRPGVGQFCGAESKFLGADTSYLSYFVDMQLLSGDLENWLLIEEHS